MVPMVLELLKVPVSSLDTKITSTPTRDAVLSVSSHFPRRQDKLLRRHSGMPVKRSKEKAYLVLEDRRKMLLAVSS